MPARESYTGQLFQLSRQRVESHGARYCILSGSYGFLWPDTPIDYYDQKMEPVTPDTVWDECFSFIKQKQFGRLCIPQEYTVLGSHLYCDAAQVLLSGITGRTITMHRPIAGMPIGRMLHAIKTLPITL